jgi:hypothetical protein
LIASCGISERPRQDKYITKERVIERVICVDCVKTCEPQVQYKEECIESYKCDNGMDCTKPENTVYCKECCEKTITCKLVRSEIPC